MMKLRCVDNAHLMPWLEMLDLDKVYEIDPRRDIETVNGVPVFYFVNRSRYGAWRFEPVPEP